MNVSCLMVTKPGREDLAKYAIDDFYHQSHPQRELVVVATSDASHLALCAHVEDWSYRRSRPADPRAEWSPPPAMVLLEEEAPLGHLRNVALDAAEGPIVCQWDDDDRYHPRRIEMQLQCMAKLGRHSCFLTSQLYHFPDGTPPFLYVVDWALAPTTGSGILIPGTLLCVKSDVRYEDALRTGEDTKFLQAEIKAHGRAATLDRPGLYARGFRAGNTTGAAKALCNVRDRGWCRHEIKIRLDELRDDIQAIGLLHPTLQLRARDNVHVVLTEISPGTVAR